MKTKVLLITILAACAFIAAYAVSDGKIVVTNTNGENTEYGTSDIKEVKFSGETMTIVDRSGQKQEYNVADVTKVSKPIEAVDLGLSVKWASMNIGAEKPADYGDYFAWGETAPKDSYTSSNSKWYRRSYSSLQSQGVIDSKGNITAKYDAATVNWGAKWRMPTRAEFEELSNKCKWTWTTQDGHNGYKVTGPNGKSIFLPAAGSRSSDDLYNAGSLGFYWSATATSDDYNAYSLYFNSSNHDWYNDNRNYGLSVRPVSE